MPITSPQFAPLAQLAAALRDGKATSRMLVEQALERIADPAGQGAIAFLQVDAGGAGAAGID
ncbi:amidase, partial [Caballeronia sp. M23-90]